MGEIHATDALIVPSDFAVAKHALRRGAVTEDERAAMRRHLKLADELRRCRYFTEEERSWGITMDEGVTTSWTQRLPDAGATRDMLGILRQLFGDTERSSFASMAHLLRRLVDSGTSEGQELLQVVASFETVRRGLLDSWDVQPGGTETSPHPPLTVFLDWMYGEYLHSDADKAKRIEQFDTEFRLYEWQFHWVSERLAVVFGNFARVVRATIDCLESA